jgi:hypothetical protein
LWPHDWEQDPAGITQVTNILAENTKYYWLEKEKNSICRSQRSQKAEGEIQKKMNGESKSESPRVCTNSAQVL